MEYTGTFIFGTAFDTSRDSETPATFDVSDVIAGFEKDCRL